MSAFKTYVMKELVGKAIIEREIQIALKEELEVERAGTPPDLTKAIPTEKVVEYLNTSKGLGDQFREVAAKTNAQVFTLKGEFSKKDLHKIRKNWNLFQRIKEILK